MRFCLAIYQNASSNSAADNSMFVLLLRDCFNDGTKVKVTSAERETALFMHMESDRKGGSRDLILEADLGGHGGYNATSLVFLEYKS